MRILIWIVVIASAAYSGYWFVGARAVETGLANWFQERRSEGWVADYAALDTIGFPNRFDTTITELELADPETGVAWTLPFFQILTLSYTPNHIIAVLPPEQVLATPVEKVTLENRRMRGSVVFVPGTRLEIDRTSFELDGLKLASTDNWQTTVETGQFATRQTAERDLSHDIYFQASEMWPSQPLLDFLDPGGLLPKKFDGVTLDASVLFDAPWDRFAVEVGRPQPVEIELKKLDAGWGELTLQATGSLQVDGRGQPLGRIDVRARNWRDMLRVAAETGIVPANILPTVEDALEILAGMSGNPETIDAPLTFRRGTMFLGGLPIGPAPSFSIP